MIIDGIFPPFVPNIEALITITHNQCFWAKQQKNAYTLWTLFSPVYRVFSGLFITCFITSLRDGWEAKDAFIFLFHTFYKWELENSAIMTHKIIPARYFLLLGLIDFLHYFQYPSFVFAKTTFSNVLKWSLGQLLDNAKSNFTCKCRSFSTCWSLNIFSKDVRTYTSVIHGSVINGQLN